MGRLAAIIDIENLNINFDYINEQYLDKRYIIKIK